ncbi:photosystem reaction center subunit H [Flavobacterium cyanobacteriorum]|uniref:Photosystem reaction center subunit H n=1 Tax=Flavobacterium cyanobacteriorum TaxID=2022802 RepID=A0A255Z9D3_9FLAO|nr:PRC-barrel domain-containing protein [Flavobacterium cyanobacteriorum]OYQ37250.1 photosystem reaction center subunit H [Flavobacterium cyanobacteriorum]
MEKHNKNLYYLDELTDYKVASHYADVRGWKLVDANNRAIGKVDDLLVNKNTKRVVYLDIEVDKDIIEQGHEPFENRAEGGTHEYINKDGENHLIVPIGSASIDTYNKQVQTNEISYDSFRKAKRFSKGQDFDRGYEVQIINIYYNNPDSNPDNNDDDSFYESRHFNDRRE